MSADNQPDEQQAAGQQQQRNGKPAARHPILERLEQHDYDFAGQSLDYEPNLEFDDTDLKQQLEEELGDIWLRRQHQGQHQGQQATTGDTNDDTNDDTSATIDEATAQPTTATTIADDDDDAAESEDDALSLIEMHLKHQQAYSAMLDQEHQARYLESPQDLMDDNFEEALKSSLFELDESIESGSGARLAKAALEAARCKQQLAGGLKSRGGRLKSRAKVRLGQLLRSATGGLYGGKPATDDDSQQRQQQQVQREQPKAGPGFFELLVEDDGGATVDESLLIIDQNDTFEDIARFNCVEVAGDDLFGRRIVTIYACRLPSDNKINHIRLLKYIMYTLDKYVESDYALVYFHYGLNSKNKPKLNFLYQAYRAFDRKYKKNLKALFLVHPTNFIRIVWQLFRPVIR